MYFLKPLTVFMLILAGGASLAFAREASEAELQKLNETIRIFQIATEKADVNTLIDQVLSPRLIREIAGIEGVDEKNVLQNTRQQIAVTAGVYQFSRCEVQLDKKVSGELIDGSPYFIIPMESVLEMNIGRKVRVKSDIAAVLDNDRWYIITGNTVRKLYIRKAYPGLEKASFSEPKMTLLDE